MPIELDTIDRKILSLLQSDCKTPLSRIGELVGLSAPSVMDRVRKLEQSGVIKGYHAVLDARALGLDVTAFVGVSINYPKMIGAFEREVAALPDVLECHHVTGANTLLIKVRTKNTASLETLISAIRAVPGVDRTETVVVLSTRTERVEVAVPPAEEEAELASARATETASQGRRSSRRTK